MRLRGGRQPEDRVEAQPSGSSPASSVAGGDRRLVYFSPGLFEVLISCFLLNFGVNEVRADTFENREAYLPDEPLFVSTTPVARATVTQKHGDFFISSFFSFT